MRVLIIDDHRIFGASLARLLLDTFPDATVEAVTGVSGTEEVLERFRPDVAIVDWGLADGTGADALRVLRRSSPTTRSLVLTGESEDGSLRRAVAAGCDGFVTKDRPPEEVLSAVAAVARGEVHFEPAALSRILAEPPRAAVQLTGREAEIVRLLAAGRTNKELAAELYLSPNTVRNHLHRIGKKLGADSRLDIVITAVHLGLVELDVAERT